VCVVSVGKKSRASVARNRVKVFARDGFECVMAGSFWAVMQSCGGGATVQHRVGRGMGGSAKWDEPPYLVSMCYHHNALIESSAEFRNYCERNGISIRRAYMDRWRIEQIPIRYNDGWFLLSADRRVPITERLAIAVFEEMYGTI